MLSEQSHHPPLPFGVGTVVQGIDEPITLVQVSHSPTLSHRWVGRGQHSGHSCEVLFVAHPDELGPLLTEDAASWGAQTVQHGTWTALVFSTVHLTPLSARIAAPDLNDPYRHAQCLALIVSIAELFEVIHVLCDALIAHASLDMFAIRDASNPPEVVLLRPELSHPQRNPPRSGSHQGSGLDAPELSGWITRPIGVAADVHILGMIAYALLTGITPTSGAEQFAPSLPPVRAFDPDVPLGFDTCIRQAVARTPEQRFPTAAAFVQALQAQSEAYLGQRTWSGIDRRVAVTWGVHSEIGRSKLERHPINQDSHIESFDPNTGWGMFAVMDGVSRSDRGSGEMASWLARTALERGWNLKRNTPIYGRRFEGDTPFPSNLMEKLALGAHDAILAQIDQLHQAHPIAPGERTLSTTLAAVALFGDRCALCNAGDSPVYLIRLDDASVEQLTVEHNQVLERLRGGWTIADAFEAPGHRQLTSVLGQARIHKEGQLQPITPDLAGCSFRLQPGDLLAVCSDGVSDAFGKDTPSVLLDTLNRCVGPRMPSPDHGDLTRAARALVQHADRQGGRDNITALLIAIGPWLEEMSS